MKSPTNLTEIAPASMAPVAVSQTHQDGVKGSLIVLNWDMAKKEPDMKNRSIGSRRMYLLRTRIPMSNMSSQAARKEAAEEAAHVALVARTEETAAAVGVSATVAVEAARAATAAATRAAEAAAGSGSCERVEVAEQALLEARFGGATTVAAQAVSMGISADAAHGRLRRALANLRHKAQEMKTG